MTKRRQKIDDMAKVRKVRERLDPTLAMKEGEMHIKRLVAFINATYGNPEHRKPWS